LTTYLFGSDEECINEMLKYVDYIPIKELQRGSITKEGYVLISEVNTYRTDLDSWVYNDGFSEVLDPITFAGMLEAESRSKFPPVTTKKDSEGNEYDVHTSKDYMWFCWENTVSSKEYDAYMIHSVYNMARIYDIKDQNEYGVLCSQG